MAEHASAHAGSGIKVNKNARIIVRNLPFATDEEKLRLSFGKYGKILDVHLPLKNGQPAGFGFINFKSVNSVDMACRHMHNTALNGRTIQVSPALAKQFYDKKRVAETAETHSVDRDDVKDKDPATDDDLSEDKVTRTTGDPNSERGSMEAQKLLHESGYKNAKKRKFDSAKTSSEFETSSTVEGDLERDSSAPENLQENRSKKTNSTNVSKTLFVRNVPFDATQATLRPIFEYYGRIEYTLPCKNPVNDCPRGTAFVRFQRAADMERALAACDPRTGEMEIGRELSGRKLRICPAVFRDKLQSVVSENAAEDRKKSSDKRNLYLINVGTVMRNTDDIEGVSESDMKKRDALQQRKKVALKNLHVFISPTRLSIHNLPKSCDDAKLRSILHDAVNHEKGAKLTECRIMRDLKRLDAATGQPVSNGFGFAEFNTHEYAMKALLALNNNPNIFRMDRRPIVEFSLENQNALLKRKRRLEHSQLRQNQLNEIKVRQKFGVPLNADDHATLAGKPLERKITGTSKAKKQHLNRAGNRGALSSWNKPKSKKKRMLNDNPPTETD